MKTSSALALAFLLSSALLPVQAVPALLSYQGRVVDGAGAGLGTGTPVNRKIIFRIFSAGTGGTPLWSEEQTVTLSNGDFSVILGQGIPATYNGTTDGPRPSLQTVFGGTDRYLEIVVDKGGEGNFDATDTPIAPRQRLISTAYALRAATADSVASGTDLSFGGENYGLGLYDSNRSFNGVSINGPVLYGAGGGALGSVNGTTRNLALTWNNFGNVGIGTAAPTERLEVLGNIKASGTVTAAGLSSTTTVTAATSVRANGANGFVFTSVGDTDGGMFSPADGTVTFRTDNIERARINSSGNFGIANNSPTEKLDVTGNIKASGNLNVTGSVSATTISTSGINVTGSVSAATISTSGLVNVGSLQINNKNLIDVVYPVGVFYVQYPNALSDVDLTAFPTAQRPAVLFPGTIWTEQFTSEGVFFRTAGGNASESRLNGLQDYALKRMTGFTPWYQMDYTDPNQIGSGVFYSVGEKRTPTNGTDSGYGSGTTARTHFDSASQVNPSLTEVRPKNRLMKIWKRTQ